MSKLPAIDVKGILNDEVVQLKVGNYKGEFVLMFFFPLGLKEDFDEVLMFAKCLKEFAQMDCKILGVTNGTLADIKMNRAITKTGFPMIADNKLELSMQMARDCGVPLRKGFIFDPSGKVKFSFNLGMDMDQIFKNLYEVRNSYRPVGRPKIIGPVSTRTHNTRVSNLKWEVENSERKIEFLKQENPFDYRAICQEEEALQHLKFSLEEAIADKEMAQENKKVLAWLAWLASLFFRVSEL